MNIRNSLNRSLNFDLPEGQSAFLWGPRKSGKTTLLKSRFPNSTYIDLLQTDRFMELLREPFRLREELMALKENQALREPVIIDEVQKVPALLDEVHALIEKENMSFVLCGSSARKLKRAGSNLLGGRAWSFFLHPLTFRELGTKFDLLKVCNHGLIPSHYFETQVQRSLRAYVNTYLKGEIHDEGLVRNLASFAQFLDVASLSNGEMVNLSNIARDCGIDSKTVHQYFEILQDTLLGIWVPPYKKRKKREIIQASPKFYLFDVGVSQKLNGVKVEALKGTAFGKAFEHFLFMELWAHRDYFETEEAIQYWRTKSGLEVDFILGKGRVAIEVKSKNRVSTQDLKGLLAFKEEHAPKQSILVCLEPRARRTQEGIDILPYKTFLKRLWNGEV